MDEARAQAGLDQRSDVRFDAQLPIRIDGSSGASHNVSAHGISFETDVPQEVGARVSFTVEFSLYGRRHRMECEGEVVRVEAHGGRTRVAARLASPFFAEEPRAQQAGVAAASA